MSKNPIPKLGTQPEEPKHLGLRYAVSFILGVSTCAAIYECQSDDAVDPPKKPGIMDVSKSVVTKKDHKSDRLHNLVSELCFEENPIDCVDVAQCRELLFRVTGNPNCKALTLDEQRENIHNSETEERLGIAEDLIDQFCISNDIDQDAIRNACMEGYTEFVRLENKEDEWCIVLEGDDKPWDEWITLEEKPYCRPELTKDEQKRKQKKKEQEEKMAKIRNGESLELLEKLDLNEIIKEAEKEGFWQISEEISGFVEKIKNINSETSKPELVEIGCTFLKQIFLMAKVEVLSPITEEGMERLDKNPILTKAIDELMEFAELLVKIGGLDDSDMCLLR